LLPLSLSLFLSPSPPICHSLYPSLFFHLPPPSLSSLSPSLSDSLTSSLFTLAPVILSKLPALHFVFSFSLYFSLLPTSFFLCTPISFYPLMLILSLHSPIPLSLSLSRLCSFSPLSLPPSLTLLSLYASLSLFLSLSFSLSLPLFLSLSLSLC